MVQRHRGPERRGQHREQPGRLDRQRLGGQPDHRVDERELRHEQLVLARRCERSRRGDLGRRRRADRRFGRSGQQLGRRDRRRPGRRPDHRADERQLRGDRVVLGRHTEWPRQRRRCGVGRRQRRWSAPRRTGDHGEQPVGTAGERSDREPGGARAHEWQLRGHQPHVGPRWDHERRRRHTGQRCDGAGGFRRRLEQPPRFHDGRPTRHEQRRKRRQRRADRRQLRDRHAAVEQRRCQGSGRCRHVAKRCQRRGGRRGHHLHREQPVRRRRRQPDRLGSRGGPAQRSVRGRERTLGQRRGRQRRRGHVGRRTRYHGRTGQPGEQPRRDPGQRRRRCQHRGAVERQLHRRAVPRGMPVGARPHGAAWPEGRPGP